VKDPRRAFRVVDDFEDELADYCGAPYAVALDSCTNALWLALLLERARLSEAACVSLPSRTYVGVAQAARNAFWEIELAPFEWEDRGWYAILPTRVVDSARSLRRFQYQAGSLTCLSFQAGKQLPIGRGGAVLTDSEDDYRWLRRARHDGRLEGSRSEPAMTPGLHCYMPPPDAARGLWLLTYLPDVPHRLPPTEYPDLRLALV